MWCIVVNVSVDVAVLYGNPPKMADTKDTVRHKNLCLTVFLE